MKIDKFYEYDEALTMSDFRDIREEELSTNTTPTVDNQETCQEVDRLLPKFQEIPMKKFCLLG